MRGSEGRNRRAWFAALGVGLCGLFPALAGAQDDDRRPPREFPPPEERPEPPARPQRVNLSYTFNLSHPEHLDRENIAALSMAASDALHLALQDGANDAFYWRIPKWGAAFAVDTAIRYVSHEYGHLSSFSKAGSNQAIFGDKDKIDSAAPKASIGKMFLAGFNPFDNSAVSISQSDWERIVDDLGGDPVLVSRFKLSVKAGGVNQEEVNLDRYTDRLFDGELSYLDTMPFLISGAAVLKYPVGIEMSDIGDYLDELDAVGLRTSASRLHVLSALTLLSGSSLAAFRGVFLGLATGAGGFVDPLKLKLSEHLEVFAPELDNYLTVFGPTLKSTIPFRLYGVMIQPGYEQLFVTGASKGELGVSVRAPILTFLTIGGSAYRNTDAGTWLETGVEILPLQWLALSVGYAWARDYSFHRDVFGANNDLTHRGENSLLLGLSAFHNF